MLTRLKELLNGFCDEKWPLRRESARKAVELIRLEIDRLRDAQKILWNGICSDNADISYWSKRVLEKTAALDFLIELLNDETVMADSEKSQHLFELFGFRFSETYPYLLANFSFFSRENKQHLIRLLSRNGDRNLIEFFSSLSFAEENEIREEAVDFLSGFHTKEALLGLFSYLNDTSFQIKSRAACRLSEGLDFLELEGNRQYLDWMLPLIPETVKDRYLRYLSCAEFDSIISLFEEIPASQRFLLMRMLPSDVRIIRQLLHNPLAEFQLAALLNFKNSFTSDFSAEISRFLESGFPEIRALALRIARESSIRISSALINSLLSTEKLEIQRILLDLVSIFPEKELYYTLKNLVLSESSDLRFYSLYPFVQFFRYDEFRDEITAVLISCFKDSYWPVRNQSSLCLKYLDNSIVPALFSVLEKETDRDIRYWSVISLGQFSDQGIPEFLIRLFSQKGSEDIHRVILESLGNFPDKSVINFFKDQIKTADFKSVVLKSMHHMDRESIEQIISEAGIDRSELPAFIRLKSDFTQSRVQAD